MTNQNIDDDRINELRQRIRANEATLFRIRSGEERWYTYKTGRQEPDLRYQEVVETEIMVQQVSLELLKGYNGVL